MLSLVIQAIGTILKMPEHKLANVTLAIGTGEPDSASPCRNSGRQGDHLGALMNDHR